MRSEMRDAHIADAAAMPAHNIAARIVGCRSMPAAQRVERRGKLLPLREGGHRCRDLLGPCLGSGQADSEIAACGEKISDVRQLPFELLANPLF